MKTSHFIKDEGGTPLFFSVYLYVCLNVLPDDTLQYFFLILVQTYSEGCVRGTADLHLVHLHLRQAKLLQTEGK